LGRGPKDKPGAGLVPVLVARGARSAESSPPRAAASTPVPTCILVPHDFSETSEAALSYALDLAEKLGARVTILHTYDVTHGFAVSVQPTAALVAEVRHAARAALDRAVARSQRPGVAVDGQLRQGSTWSEIDALAAEAHADLIVMGTHGRRGISRALLGSVAEKVVRTGPCPVLTVHQLGRARPGEQAS
jgi:nucleotide-binding universal stress UspA family protein